MNNLLSYCGLVDARISASEKDLKAINQRKQFSTPRKSNPGNVLLTSRNPQNYFYQCKCKNSRKESDKESSAGWVNSPPHTLVHNRLSTFVSPRNIFSSET